MREAREIEDSAGNDFAVAAEPAVPSVVTDAEPSAPPAAPPVRPDPAQQGRPPAVPAPAPEAKGLYALESMASGVPVARAILA